MNELPDQEFDSSDSEGGGDSNSDDDGELSFESDEEGNFKQNAQRVGNGHAATATDSDDDDVEGEDDEEDSYDEEADDEEDEGVDDEEDEDDDDDEVEDFTDDEEAEESDETEAPELVEAVPAAAEPKPVTEPKQKAEPKQQNKKKTPNAVQKLQSELQAGGSAKPASDDEYKEDTSDEEDIRNTVGNIPMHWYDEYKHIGYDWDARKIIKAPQRDQLDDFLKRMEDPNFWRTVKDVQTGQDIIISEADIELIKRINSQKIPDASFNEYTPWIDWFTNEVEQMPIKNVPAHKRSFLPSRSEKKTVSKLVHAIKSGWIKTTEERKREKADRQRGPKFYMLWETDNDKEKMRRIHDHVSAPKRDLPGHAESYNPPKEYLFDAKEMKEWHKYKDEPQRRKLHFMPQKYGSLREVPAYSRYVRERFLRCLDLYLCPRAKRMKLTIDAEYLIPKLPSPKDLQPFPTVESMVFEGHTDMIRTISVEPNGEYMVSGSDDTTVKSKCAIRIRVVVHAILFTLTRFVLQSGRSPPAAAFAPFKPATLCARWPGVRTPRSR